MKKGLKYVLSVLICLLIAGSGFSAWYFQENNKLNKSGVINGSITVSGLETLDSTLTIEKAASPNNVVLYDSTTNTGAIGVDELNLTLDQGTVGENDGIYIGTGSATSIDLVFRLAISAGAGTSIPAVTMTPTVTLSEALREYLDISFVTTSGKTDVNTTPSGDSVIVYKTLSFTYKENKKPTTSAQYETMNNLLKSGQSVTVTVAVSST